MDRKFSAIENIERRVSIRAFAARSLAPELATELLQCAMRHSPGPFGGSVRYQLITVPEADIPQLRGLGTYGMIRGATSYLAAAIRSAPHALMDFGYCMEAAILEATNLGISTCWIGGTLNRSRFGELMNLKHDEILPAVTPLGYPGEKGSPLVTLARLKRGIRRRKPAGELFFAGKPMIPLDLGGAGKYRKVLECVRLGPSASNRQPWRIIREVGENIYHLYLKENRRYDNSWGGIKVQYLDMGIAMCHFEMSARELGLLGSWATEEVAVKNLQYVATWRGE